MKLIVLMHGNFGGPRESQTPPGTFLGGRSEAVRPTLSPVARPALDVELGLRLQLVHFLVVLLHDVPRHIRAVGRHVAAVLAWEEAVLVALLALVVALERVEVVVVARLLRIPLLVDLPLGLERPDAVVSRDIIHLDRGGSRW